MDGPRTERIAGRHEQAGGGDGMILDRLRQPPGGSVSVGVDRLEKDWTFRPSRPDLRTILRRRAMRDRLVPAPAVETITPVRPRARWALYFIYAPDGRLRPSHRFTLRRLRSDGNGLAVVFASPSPSDMPPELPGLADALYWKDLPGFDFSAYAIGLRALAEHSAGCDVLVMNDSVYGPFCAPDALWRRAAWDLTGFTASGNIQNHVQSYAFLLRNWNADKLGHLSDILRDGDAYDDYRSVVFCQETRFAGQAAQVMSVGAWWYAEHRHCSDPTIHAALALLREGFPFQKKSLFTKYAHLVDQDAALAALTVAGHPPPDGRDGHASDRSSR